MCKPKPVKFPLCERPGCADGLHFHVDPREFQKKEEKKPD